MLNNRKPEEIAAELIPLQWKVRELETELDVSNKVYSTTPYDRYRNKWVLHDAYESGSDYIYVLGISATEDVYFYGYGVSYDEQSKELSITDYGYPKNFLISYPDNLTIIEGKVVDEIIRMLKIELVDLLNIEDSEG